MKFLSLIGLASATTVSDLDSTFMQYVTKYGKSYGTQSEF